MKNILCVILLFVAACKSHPCFTDTAIYSRNVGTVIIGGETCQIIETYREHHWGKDYYSSIDECHYWDEILTRITKCPSFSQTNLIRKSDDKSHKEVIE